MNKLRSMPDQHLAELNIARLSYRQDDPRAADFFNNLAMVNGIAERSPGFVWRLLGEGGNATDIRAFDDPRVIVNLSLWESLAALEQFVFATLHKRFFQRKVEWFSPMVTPHFVMWPVAVGDRPDINEAAERLAYLTRHGDSDHAFGWTYARKRSPVQP